MLLNAYYRLRNFFKRFTRTRDFKPVVHEFEDRIVAYDIEPFTNKSHNHGSTASDNIMGECVYVDSPLGGEGIVINLRGIMSVCSDFDEVVTRLIETEIHEMVHWGLTKEENMDLGREHQLIFDYVVGDMMDHCGVLRHDIRKKHSESIGSLALTYGIGFDETGWFRNS